MYKVKRSFVATIDGVKYRYSEGDAVESIPEGADWIKAGFLEGEPPATKRKTATSSKAKKRTKRSK